MNLKYDSRNVSTDLQLQPKSLSDHAALVKNVVYWAKEFEADKILATVDPAFVLIIEDWRECKVISDTQSCNDQKYFITPLPFYKDTFPFLLCTGYESINILNVNTGKM